MWTCGSLIGYILAQSETPTLSRWLLPSLPYDFKPLIFLMLAPKILLDWSPIRDLYYLCSVPNPFLPLSSFLGRILVAETRSWFTGRDIDSYASETVFLVQGSLIIKILSTLAWDATFKVQCTEVSDLKYWIFLHCISGRLGLVSLRMGAFFFLPLQSLRFWFGLPF